MADINSQVLEALNQGIGPQDIINHLSSSENPEHKNWVRQYRLNQVENDSKDKLGLTESAVQTNEDAIKKQAELINQQGDVGVSPGKLAQIGIVGKVGYELGKQIPAAAEYGSKLFGTLKDKMAVPSEVQATGAEAPVAEAAPSGMAKLQERFNLVPKKESTPEETRQQRLKAAAAAAQGEMANVVPGAAVPGAVTPTAATPSVVEAVTPAVDAAITSDPVATPAEKAQALVHAPEAAPTTVETAAPAETIAPVSKTSKAKPIEGAVEPKTLLTGTGKTAYVGEGPMPKERWKSSYPDVQSVPKGYAFVPGAQAINTVRQNVGQEPFTKHYTGNAYPASYDEALQQGRDINKSMGRMTRDEMKAAGIAPPPTTEGIGRIIGTKGQRLVNVGIGGAKTAGMLVAISDLVNAQSMPQVGESLGNLAIGSIPGVGPAAALYSGNAAAPTLTETNLPPEVRKNLEIMRQNLSPTDYAKMRTSYLQNAVSNGLPPTSREQLLSNLQSGYQARPAANTLLPVRPPR